MLIHGIFLVTAIGGATALCLAVPALSLWWLLPLAVGGYAALAVLLILGTLTLSFPAPKMTGKATRRRYYRFLSLAAAWVMVLCGVRVRLHDADKLPTDRPFLLVANHLSNLDPLVTIAALRRWPLSFVSKPENFRIPVVGTILRNSAFLAIDRENPRRAVETIRAAAGLITDKELCVGIYPEGTRNKTGEGLLPFHNGSFKIATMAKCPVAVLTVRYGKGPFPYFRHADLTVVGVMDDAFVCNNRTDILSDTAREWIEKDLI